MKKRILSALLSVVMLIGLLPLSASAATEELYVDTWEELRDALQSSKKLDVRVAANTVIEYTFDSSTQDYRDVQITVNGQKHLAIFGEIVFRNALGNGAGLINLNEDAAYLEVYGSSKGKFTYILQGGEAPEVGDMFYMTAGSLSLGGNVTYVVDYAYHDNRIKVHQAVIGGTGGSARVKCAFLHGNTIFGEGIDFLFTDGLLGGVYQSGTYSYQNLDLFMETGSATFAGCTFRRGIMISDRCDAEMMIQGDKTVCVNLNEAGYAAVRNYVIYNAPCAFYRYGPSNLSPAMPEGSTLCNMGEFGLGETIPTVEAQLEYQSNGLGTRLMQYATMEVYRDDELIYEEETSLHDDRELSYDFTGSPAGDYAVYIDTRLAYDAYSAVRTETYGYRLSIVDRIAHVDVTLDKGDMNSLDAVQDFADVSSITWYEKSKTGSTWTANPSSLRDGYTYAVEFSVLSVGGNYPFKNDYTVSVDGVPAVKQSSGKWRFEYVKTGYLSRVEMYDICLPAPGHHPDFTAHKDNPPYSSYEVSWRPYVDGEFGEVLTSTDVFEENTSYLLEVVLTADAGFEFDYAVNDEAYAYINNKKASVYYPDRNDESVIVAYTYYDTSNCISQIYVCGVQYPIGGKTPDTTVYTDGYKQYTVDGIAWYYETNPGTASAGFSKLDGRFKTDRRHQAYIEVAAKDNYWFATDNKGNLSVAAYIDGEPMAFAYATDSYTDDGAINTVEFARTFERAQDVDGVFVDGMWLTDGLYLDSLHWGVQTEDTVDKDEGYAYYKDGVLTLHDFYWEAQGDYDAVHSYRPLTIKAEGENYLDVNGVGNGIVTSAPLTLTSDGKAASFVDIVAKSAALMALDTVTVLDGEWKLSGYNREGAWIFDTLTVKGGTFSSWGEVIGIEGEDQPLINVEGGTLKAFCESGENAISWCDIRIADDATVYVGNHADDPYNAWDGVTGFDEYGYVKIFVKDEVLLGDVDLNGTVNTRDALALFRYASSKASLTEAQLAVADMDGNGSVNMRDALALFQQVSSR